MSLPSPVLTYHSVALPLNVRLENQPENAHVAIAVIPEVTVEFSTVDDKEDEEQDKKAPSAKQAEQQHHSQQHQQQQQMSVVTGADDIHETR